MRKTYVHDPETGKMVLKSRRCQGANAPVVHGDVDDFISPIDGSLIDDRGKLRRHNKKHGVTDMRDYSEDFIQKRGQRRVRDEQQELTRSRKADLVKAFDRHGG